MIELGAAVLVFASGVLVGLTARRVLRSRGLVRLARTVGFSTTPRG